MGNLLSAFRRKRRPSSSPDKLSTSNIDVDVVGCNSYPMATGIPVATATAAATIGHCTAAASASTHPAEVAQLELNVSAEQTALASGNEQKLLAMLSIKAPAAEAVDRPPIDLVACIDKSGSMQGEKMRLMKQTLELLVTRAGLNGGDRLSLVSFDSRVTLELPLRSMDKRGVEEAEVVVKRLSTGSTTNLSGGALKAIDVLACAGPAASKPGSEQATRAVMLFTDGRANEGIRDKTRLVAAVTGALSAATESVGGPINLFTFGFGDDHDERCLRDLATGSGAAGLYYYISSAEDIPSAFADCLGGLTSVVAQNATLSLTALGSTSISRVLGSTYKCDGNGDLMIGDLFAEDEKDILVELSLPKLSTPNNAPSAVLSATLKGFNVGRGRPDVVTGTLDVARPALTPKNQPINVALNAQRNRIETVEAMESASRMADEGNVEGGRSLLMAVKGKVQASPSAAFSLSSQLVNELDELGSYYESGATYRSVGGKMSRMSAMSHARQRSTHSNVGTYSSGAAKKMALKASWSSSLTPS